MRQKSSPPETLSDRLVRDIRRATRKQYSAEEKIRIVLDGLRGEVSIAELCRREGIAESLGVLTVVLHETFRYPLRLPGHHGLEAMAILMLGRLMCTSPWSATIVCLSAFATHSGFGGHADPSKAFVVLAPGILLDVYAQNFRQWRQYLWLVPVVVAFAFATKPLIRLTLASMAGVNFGSLASGVLYPFATHLAYGFTGAPVAVGLWKATTGRLLRSER